MSLCMKRGETGMFVAGLIDVQGEGSWSLELLQTAQVQIS